uniref:Uncharacterized protein n=1 Tax=Panagrolaimus superbus TaxID=310955 RepID=A0A914XXH2_9BILA
MLGAGALVAEEKLKINNVSQNVKNEYGNFSLLNSNGFDGGTNMFNKDSIDLIKKCHKSYGFKDATVPEYPLIINEVIEDVAEALLRYFKKQFQDFLPGGDHYESGKQTETVPRSNRRVESIFGLATWGFQHAPNQRTVVREAKILATVNKVFEWFDKKTSEEKEKIIKEAMSAAPIIENDAAAQVKAFEDETRKRLLWQKEADEKKIKVNSRKEKEAYDKEKNTVENGKVLNQ